MISLQEYALANKSMFLRAFCCTWIATVVYTVHLDTKQWNNEMPDAYCLQ